MQNDTKEGSFLQRKFGHILIGAAVIFFLGPSSIDFSLRIVSCLFFSVIFFYIVELVEKRFPALKQKTA